MTAATAPTTTSGVRPTREPAIGQATIIGLPGHFCLHYQPQLDLRSGAIERCEALLRWWHPEFGLLRPHRTLGGTRWEDDLADLEEWALADACRQGAAWEHDGLHVQIALNVSPGFLLGAEFASASDRALADSGLAPRRLAIDVPFRILAKHPRETQATIAHLAAADVGVIVDGVVGDARPWIIGQIDAEAWKIDLARDRHPRTKPHPSVRRAIDDAHRAGALAIAKAVEDDRELVELRSLGCDGLFGEVVSPDLPAAQASRAFRRASRPVRSLFGVSS